MARFNAEGIDGLMLTLQQFEEIPDDVVEEMLIAGGAVVEAAQKAEIRSLGLVESGRLADSIQSVSKVGKRDGIRKRFVLVYPAGSHHKYTRRKKTKAYKRSKHGRTYTVGGDVKTATNAEVGFVHEFGAPRAGIPAKQWMAKANEKSADAMVAAEMAVYDKWLKSMDL